MIEHDADDVLKQLREELGRISTPPAFASGVRQRIAAGAGDPVDVLAEELGAVAVSPEFKARVRQQVEAAEQRRAASWLRGWRWLAPVAAAAGVAIVAVIIWRGSNELPAPVTATAATTAVKPMSRTPSEVAQTSRSATEVKRPVRAEPVARTAPATAASSTTEPSLEVITNQPAILRAMYARIAADATVVDTMTIPLSDTAPDIVVPPIEISPIVVKSLADPPVVGGAQPIIRRVTADTAERSQK
jgi:hypothetical protein